jgi:AraC family transcriptional regulator of adaptative response/methylated-DNA-[protein]-cysteine methyltransferase
MQARLPDEKTMYRALVQKDPTYDGVFFAAVKTTGVFCRPTCRSRKPKRENVEFYRSAREALAFGFRPCRVCRPLELAGTAPEWVGRLFGLLADDPTARVGDADLQRMGIEPARARRWFKKHYGMTFQAYLRGLRIGEAVGRLRAGEKVINAAFDAGFDSLSGFTEAFRKTIGGPPRIASTRSTVAIARVLTPLGPMLAGATEEGLCLLEFFDRRGLPAQLERLGTRFGSILLPGRNPHLEAVDAQLSGYFDGTRTAFDLRLDLKGTDFQTKVWRALLEIPYGTTVSYGDLARRLGRPAAVRAVARANGDNRIAIVIPCHRVVGADGRLTGYGGGLWRKRFLLELEREAAASGRPSAWPGARCAAP